MKEITLIITSCNRLELLQETVKSFEKFNTYPIKKAVIIEDSGKEAVYNQLLDLYGDRFKILFNDPPLKHIRSVDRAYKEIDTEYIFHCQDDWQFYRSGFIEDALNVLEKNPTIKQVGFRSIYHDVLLNHPTIALDPVPIITDGIKAYQFVMKPEFKKYDWITCTFNPCLLRKKDYDLCSSYISIGDTEAKISKWYREKGFTAVLLENDAVLHLGWESSAMGHYKKPYSLKIRSKNVARACLNLFGANLKYKRG